MALTVRQVGQVAAPLKQKVEEFQKVIDSNDDIVKRIEGGLERVKPQREKLSACVQQRQDDRRNLVSSLARLEDALASFGVESRQLEAIIEELPRLLELISLPAGQQGMIASMPGGMGGPGGGGMDGYGASRRIPAAAIELPLPYFDILAKQFEERTLQINARVRAIESALATYCQKASGAPVGSQIEAVVRSEYAQFRALAAQVAEVAHRLEQLREVAIRTKRVPAGMLARLEDRSFIVDQRAQVGGNSNLLTGGTLALPSPGMMGVGGVAPQMGQNGGMLGQNTGGGLFGGNPGGGLFGQNTGGGLAGGMFAQNTGGGLFGGNAGGGMFGANIGGGMFAQNTGGGMFGANTGGGLFGGGAQAGGGMFGQNTGGGGLFGGGARSSGGGLFGGGAPAGGGMFGANTGGGLFGQNTGGGLFGGAAQSSGGGMFGAPAGGGLFGGAANTGGGLFGGAANTGGGGLFGQAPPAGGGLFGQPAGGGGLFGQTGGGGF